MSEPGTLQGLITDLEELHQPYIPSESENLRDSAPNRVPAFCMFCGTRPDRLVWPCPTIELARKHKRAQWSIGIWGIPENDQKTNFVQNINRFGLHFFEGTKAGCEAWIDRQVNGEK